MGVLGRAHRDGARDVRAARRRRGRRRRGDDVALRRASARSRARSTSRAAEGRDQRLRVPDDRADLARAGAARRRGRARPGRRRRDPRRAVRGGDRRARPRSSRSPPSATGTARASTSRRSRASRTSTARSSCSTPTRRSGTYPLDVRALGVDVLAAGVLKYLLGSAGLGFMWTRPGLSQELLADADRLVRRREHLRDGHHRLLAVADRAALPVGHAADPGDLRRHRRAWS